MLERVPIPKDHRGGISLSECWYGSDYHSGRGH
jgi:hypothetical protein